MKEFLVYLLDQLSELPIQEKKMFGGYGLWLEGVFFGLIHDDELYLYTTEETRKKYCTEPFKPNNTQTLHNYYHVPATVLEDEEKLLDWVQEAQKEKIIHSSRTTQKQKPN